MEIPLLKDIPRVTLVPNIRMDLGTRCRTLDLSRHSPDDQGSASSLSQADGSHSRGEPRSTTLRPFGVIAGRPSLALKSERIGDRTVHRVVPVSSLMGRVGVKLCLLKTL